MNLVRRCPPPEVSFALAEADELAAILDEPGGYAIERPQFNVPLFTTDDVHYSSPSNVPISLRSIWPHIVIKRGSTVLAEAFDFEPVEILLSDGRHDDLVATICNGSGFCVTTEFSATFGDDTAFYRILEVYELHNGACPFFSLAKLSDGANSLCAVVKSPDVLSVDFEPTEMSIVIPIRGGVAGNLTGFAPLSSRVKNRMSNEWNVMCDADPDECDDVIWDIGWAGYWGARCAGTFFDLEEAPDGTVGNALQHAMWNAMMAQDLGVTKAKAWANAQEKKPGQTGCTNPKAGSNEKMDCTNNALGRGVGDSNPDATAGQLRSLIRQAIEAAGSNYIVLVGGRSCVQ